MRSSETSDTYHGNNEVVKMILETGEVIMQRKGKNEGKKF
jgi:hypothetical protein